MGQPLGKPELLKEINRAHILEILKSTRTISRPELARQTGLSRATIAILTDDLLKAQLIRESGLGDSTGGRPPVLLEFNPDAAYALGAHMYDYAWNIVVTNLDAEIKHQLDVNIVDQAPETAVETLRQGIETLKGQFDAEKLLPAVGLGTPGLVDVESGVIKSAVDVGWFEVPIGQMVEEALGIRTFVANRSKVGALAEYWYGSGYGVDDLIYISIGTGVAAGIVHQGELYVGVNSSAGELGHITILPDGPRCPCGNRGCLQQLVSGPAIASRAREKLRGGRTSVLHTKAGNYPETITAATVFQAAEEEDELAREIVAEIAAYLGIAVATLINLFNPDLIVLGGPVGQAGQVLTPSLQEEVRRRAMAYPLSAAEVTTSSLGLEAGAIGASVLVLQQASELLFET